MYPDNNDYKLYHAQALYQACLYDQAFQVLNYHFKEPWLQRVPSQASNKLLDKAEYKAQITKLQAAIKYSQDDVLSVKNLVDSCPADDPDKEVNLACLLYKVSF